MCWLYTSSRGISSLSPPTLPKPPCFVLIFTGYSCRTSINIKVWPIDPLNAVQHEILQWNVTACQCPTLTLTGWFTPQLQWSVSHAPLGATVSDPETENMGKKGMRREWWKEGWETSRMERVRACRNADDGQECWKAASDKNLSHDDSSVSMCPLRDDGSVLLLLGDLSLQWCNHQLRLVGLSEHTVKVRPNKHGPLAYLGANVLCV